MVLVPINAHKSIRLRESAEALYQQLLNAGFDILFDDRGQRPGVAFADMDLIGIPHRLILGERGLDNGLVEYKCRADGSESEFSIVDVVEELRKRLKI